MAAIISEYNHTCELVELLNGSVGVYQIQNDSIRAYQSELANMLGEMNACRGDIEKLLEEKELYEEKSLSVKRQMSNLQTMEALHKTIQSELQNEIDGLIANESKVADLIETLSKTREENRRNQTHEGQMNLLRNDYEILNEIEMTQTKLLNSTKALSDPKQSLESTLLKKYLLLELLMGIKILDKSSKSGGDVSKLDDVIEIDMSRAASASEREQSWFEIWLTNLPDECLYSEKNFEHLNQLPELKKKMMSLSPALLDSYRMLFQKRKQKLQNEKGKKEKPAGGCVIVDNLEDFQIIRDNYENLLCNILTKQEIEEAMRTFAIDWIEGSQILTVLINSKSSKIATVVVPKYYPMCGTSMIKLISLTGYDDAVARKFKIETELGSLSEWIAQFTELYNNNKIDVQPETKAA